MSAAFYCVADDPFFLGAVGLVNSLRFLGHREPIFMLDCGLTAEQRSLLEPEVSLVEAPEAASPHLLKAIAPLRHRADTVVLIDTDMIATRSLAPLLELASRGRVVAFENDRPRYCEEWGALLGLGATRPGPYVSSGLVCFGGETGRQALDLFADGLPGVDFDRTFWREHDPGYPFLYADQDVLNGVLRTAVEPDLLIALEHRLAPVPPFTGLRLRDADSLRCSFADGTEPFVLHHFNRKPWLVARRANVYSRLLTSLLLGDDVAIRLDPGELPVRLRRGFAGTASRIGVDALLTPQGILRRVRERFELGTDGPPS